MNKNNSRYNIYIVSVITVFVLLYMYGCEDILDVPNRGSLGENVLANEEGVNALLTGAYGAIDGGGLDDFDWINAPHNWIFGSVVGGDAYKGSEPGDQSNMNAMMQGEFSPVEPYYNAKWRTLYEGVSRTNAVIALLDQVEDMTENQKIGVEGEARFLRGYFYFELRKMFYRPPWIDETITVTQANQPNDREIWPDIEEDFQLAFDNLPEVQSQRGRVNSWAAGAFLAKTYVYQHKWNEAKALFDQIINNGMTSQGVPYDLANGFTDNWDPELEDGNPERVFYVEQGVGSGSRGNGNAGLWLNYPFPNSPLGCCGFFQPTQDLVNSYRTENGLPIIDGYNNEMVTSDYGISSSELFETYDGELDPRLDWTVVRRGAPFHDWGPFVGDHWIRDQSYGGPYYGQKHMWWRKHDGEYTTSQSPPGTAIDIPIIRFADVLLMAAEAEVEVGSLEQAREYVNRVRERAARPDTWVNNDLNRAFAAAIVNSEAEMLALDVNQFEWVVRDDRNTTFMFIGSDPSNLGHWNEYSEPNYDIELYSEPWNDADFARDAVRFERKLELAMEGQRFFELGRWDAADVLNALYAYEGSWNLGGGFAGGQFGNWYFPIPQRQIDLSDGVLQQNPGYN